ncbi:MAG: hypothetical protein VXZ82_02250 [Planctomycetota bacterium]|nr:hypothetical protein [Planctomycetota bacterium]
MILRTPFSPSSRTHFALIVLTAIYLLAVLTCVVSAGGPLRHLVAHHSDGGRGWLHQHQHSGEVQPVGDVFVQEGIDFCTASVLQEVVLELPISPQLTITNINGSGSDNLDVRCFDKIVYGHYHNAKHWKLGTLTIPPICFTPSDVCESGECSEDPSNAAEGNFATEDCVSSGGSRGCC